MGPRLDFCPLVLLRFQVFHHAGHTHPPTPIGPAVAAEVGSIVYYEKKEKGYEFTNS